MAIKTDLTVGACIVSDKKVLLVLHAKLGKWLFPGGHIRQNETPDEAIVREVKEETGLDFSFTDYGPIEETRDMIKRLAIPIHANMHSVGDHNHYCVFYLGTVDNKNFHKNNESKEIRWFSREELQKLNDIPENVRNVAAFALNSTQR